MGAGLKITISIAIVIAGMWAGSLYVYNELEFLDGSIVMPWSFIIWDLEYGSEATNLFQQAYLISLSGVFAAVLFAFLGRNPREEPQSTTFGSARWASRKEIEDAGLLNQEGVVLGMLPTGEYLRHNGPEHVKVIAPTRSGKGVGLVIPTLLTWPGSTIVYDLKSENWNVTAGYRSKFSRTIYFNPNDPNSAHFNPHSEVRLGELEVRDVQNIADMIVDPDGLGMKDHWAKTGHSLLVGAILHMLYAEPDKTLSGLADFLSNPERTLIQTLELMMNAEHVNGETHPVVASAARDMLNKSENERSSVLSTAMSFLSLYRDPIVAKNTADSDFTIKDLMQSDEPLSLYLVIPPSDINRLRPLFRLIINQICRRLTEELNPKENKHRLLLLLDEFPALGRLEFFETALGVIAGYGMKAMLISQSVSQIDKTYGPRNSVLDHTHVRVLFAPNTIETAEVVSRMLGSKTESVEKKNYGGSRFAPWLGHVTVSDHEMPRPLLTPGEVMELGDEESLVFVAGKPPIRAKKVFYYKDLNFGQRLLPSGEANNKAAKVVPLKSVEPNNNDGKAPDNQVTDSDDEMKGVM